MYSRIIFLFLFTACFFACQKPGQDTVENIKFIEHFKNWEIVVPKAWKIDENVKRKVTDIFLEGGKMPDHIRPIINVSSVAPKVRYNTKTQVTEIVDQSLTEYANSLWANDEKALEGFKLIKREDISDDEVMRHFRFKDPKTTFILEGFTWLKKSEKRIYIISCTALQKQFKEVERIFIKAAKSFKIKKPE